MKVEPNFDECEITTIDKEYKEKFNKYVYYHWVAKRVSKAPNNLNNKISQILACSSESQFEIQTHNPHKSHR